MAIRIVQLTDLHLHASPQGRGAANWHGFERALAHVRANCGQVDQLVLTGDLASKRRPETYARLRAALAPWENRVRVLPGNHDSRPMLRASFHDMLGCEPQHAAFLAPLGSWTLLGLDSLRPRRVHGRLGDAQLAWLQRELPRVRTPLVAFVHHPPIRVGCWWLDKDLLRDREELGRALGKARVLAMFCGHVHQEHCGSFGELPVFTTPSTAYQFPPAGFWPHKADRAPAYRVIDLDPEGRSLVTRVARVPARVIGP
jgi:Icc protein